MAESTGDMGLAVALRLRSLWIAAQLIPLVTEGLWAMGLRLLENVMCTERSDLTYTVGLAQGSVTAFKEWQSTARFFQQLGKVTHFASLLIF